MNFPTELKYSKDHEWIKVNGQEAFVGITEFAQGELGDIVFVDITTVGKAFKANEIFGSVEAVKTVSDLFLPVAGTILEVNSKLESNPELVNSDPYGEGWMVKISIHDTQEFEKLLDDSKYRKLIGL